MPEGVGIPEEAMVVVVPAAVVVSVVVAEADSDDEAEAEADGVGVGVALPPSVGIETVTPLAAQVSLTLEMTSASSSGEQAFFTQGVTAAKRESAFWQWHLKSSSWEQPSEVRGPMKQLSCNSCLVKALIRQLWSTYRALGNIRKLSSGNSGQSNEGGDSEGLHCARCE